ncbi:MAG: hypothetical protein HKM05_10515 [Spirochaetales bacterium]|nr:hypothetical protein [Spirochaetales bacterium]
MRKILPFLFVWTFAALPASAQLLSDLNNPIYHDLRTWQNQGYIRLLPMVEPYSGILMKALLREAEENGDATVKARALAYENKYFKPLTYPDTHLSQYSLSSSRGYFGLSQVSEQLRGMLGPYVYLDGAYSLLGLETTSSDPNLDINNIGAQLAPIGTTLPGDYKVDKTAVSAKGQQFAVTWSYNTSLSVGNSAISFQTGYSRTAIDPYQNDSIILSPQAQAAPQMLLTWRTRDTAYQSLFLALAARDIAGQGPGAPQKYLNFSSFQWRTPSPLELDLYQTVIYGQRVDLGYFIPGFPFMQAEMYGNTDNLFLGAGAKYFFPHGLRADAQLYLDDFTIVSALAGKNPGFKAAGNLNLDWTPEDPGILEQVGLEYTIVTPYTYTHTPDYLDNPNTTNYTNYVNGVSGASDPINYLDYTNNGSSLGTVIGPNSDRLRLNARFRGPAKSTFTYELSMIRHGDASAGANTAYYTYLQTLNPGLWGTVFDPGYDTNNGGSKNLFETMHFLTQNNVMTVFQTSVGFQIPVPMGKTLLTPFVNVLGEWYTNRGTVIGDNGFTAFVTVGGTWDF